jgi:hypothetical protein
LLPPSSVEVLNLDQIDEVEAKRRAELARRRNAPKPGKAEEKVQHIDPERLSKAIEYLRKQAAR